MQRMDPDGARLPTFAREANPREAAAFPVGVAGAVVAVLYVDTTSSDAGERHLAVTEIDILARHAGRMLEAITVQQAAGLRPPPVARLSQPPPASGGGTTGVFGTARQRPFEGFQ
jgi:hypothetical protein